MTRYALLVFLGIGALGFAGTLLALIIAVGFDLAPLLLTIYRAHELDAIRTAAELLMFLGSVVMVAWSILFAKQDPADRQLVATLYRAACMLDQFAKYSRTEQDAIREDLVATINRSIDGRVS